MPKAPYTREQWLNRATTILRRHFKAAGYVIPDKVRISCGLPSRRAFSKKNRTVGQAWPTDASMDDTHEIFISPWLDDPVEVFHTLAHELVHAAVGNEHGHKGPFRKCAIAIGLEGPMTSTVPNPDFLAWIVKKIKTIPTYPHARLDDTKRRKQGTRLIKIWCPSCGYTVRVTAKWLAVGLPTCVCGTTFTNETTD